MRKGEYSVVTGGKTRSRACEVYEKCQKIYEVQSSFGSVAERFMGCQGLDDFLQLENLIVYSSSESFFGNIDLSDLQVGSRVNFHKFVELKNTPYSEDIFTLYKDTFPIDPEVDESLYIRAIDHSHKEDLKKAKIKKRRSSKRYMDLIDNTLTAKQKKVIEAYYIDNFEKLSQKDTAEKIKMNFHTFKDHLAAAIKKIKTHYRDKKVKSVAKYTQDLIHGGFWSKSQGNMLRPLKYKAEGVEEFVEIPPENLEAFKKTLKPGPKRKWLPTENQDQGIENSFEAWLKEDQGRYERKLAFDLTDHEKDIGAMDLDDYANKPSFY